MNPVTGIQDEQKIKQLLLQHGIQAIRKRAGYMPGQTDIEGHDFTVSSYPRKIWSDVSKGWVIIGYGQNYYNVDGSFACHVCSDWRGRNIEIYDSDIPF